MPLTVEELLTFGGLQDARVVGGAGGLQRAVESISVLEVAEPEVAAWMLPGQLYITSLYAIRSDTQTQLKVIEALHQAGGCGLVVCHIDRWVRKLAANIIALCDRLDFPLIIANPEVSYVEILNPVIERLVHIADGDSQLFLTTQNRLIELAANEDSPAEIFQQIATMFRHEILFFDRNNQSLYADEQIAPERMQNVEAYLRVHDAEINTACSEADFVNRTIDDQPHLIYPIRSAGRVYGFMVADAAQENEPPSRKMLGNIARVCTLIYTRKTSSQATAAGGVQDTIHRLIAWDFPDDAAALAAGALVGVALAEQHIALAVIVDQPEQYAVQQSLRDTLPRLVQAVKQAHPQNVAVLYEGGCFVLLHQASQTTCERLQQLCLHHLSAAFSIGVSNGMVHFREIPKAWHEAVDAAQLGRRFIGACRVNHYAALGFLPLLSECRADAHLTQIAAALLQPLRDYDRQHNARLCRTLQCILQNDMDLNAASTALSLHKNTVLYRKNKIIDVLGVNPFRTPYLLHYLLAFALADSQP